MGETYSRVHDRVRKGKSWAEWRHLLGCRVGCAVTHCVSGSFSALMGVGKDIYKNNIWTGKVRLWLICVTGSAPVPRHIGAKLLGSKCCGEGCMQQLGWSDRGQKRGSGHMQHCKVQDIRSI